MAFVSEPEKRKWKFPSPVRWLAWWLIDEDELQRQVCDYESFRFWQTPRGWSVIALAFSAVATVLMAIVGLMPKYLFLDAVLFAVLALFIYRGQRWAMVGAMLLWTFEKGYALLNADAFDPAPFTQIIWWTVYMHAFYMAFKVEQERNSFGISCPVKPLVPTKD